MSYQPQAITLHAGQLLEVVGESYRQDALWRVASRAPTTSGTSFPISAAAPETWPKASAVASDGFGSRSSASQTTKPTATRSPCTRNGVGQIGYLGRDDAIDYQPVLAALRKRGVAAGSCPAVLIGGEADRPTLGVMICLSSPTRILQDLDESMPV